MNYKIIKKWISNIVTVVLFLMLLIFLMVIISTKASGGEPQIFGYQIKTVLSGSMEPGIKTGSIIVVKKGGDMTRFKKGDVITFKMDQKNLATHRISQVYNDGKEVIYRTKGDHNKTEDINPVLSQNVVAEYTGLTIPYLGYFIAFTNSKNGAFLLFFPGVVLLIYSIMTIWSAISKIDIKERKEINTIEK